MRDFESLNNYYNKHEKEINSFINDATNKISKTMFRRAYTFSPVEDESDVEVLTKITAGDYVYYYETEEFYDVKSADNQLGLANLEDFGKLVSIEKLDREMTPPSMCMGHLLQVDQRLKQYVLENLENVSRIGFEIYRVADESDDIFLGIPSVASSGTVEMYTPLFIDYEKWGNKRLRELKAEVKANGI